MTPPPLRDDVPEGGPKVYKRFSKLLLRQIYPSIMRSDDGVIDVLVGTEDVIAGRYLVVGMDDLSVTAVLTDEEPWCPLPHRSIP